MDRFILELPNFVPRDLCNQMIDKFESDPRKTTGVIELGEERVVIPDMKSSKELCLSNFKEWKEIDTSIGDYVDKAINLYIDHIKQEFEYNQTIHALEKTIKDAKTIDDGYTIQRQSKGGKYGWHYDVELVQTLLYYS